MKRVLIKISGEALQPKQDAAGCGKELYSHPFVNGVAEALGASVKLGVQVAVVVGAGNIWRGRQGEDMDRTTADRMGMLATVINSFCLKDAIIRAGYEAVVMTAIPMVPFAETYDAEIAKRYLSAGKIVIFGAGLGMPFVSTDTAGAVRAAEIEADAMLMAKNVDYIYTADPRKDPTAQKLTEVSCSYMLEKGLGAIDATAAAFCRSVRLPVQIFGLEKPEDIYAAVKGEKPGTVVIPE